MLLCLRCVPPAGRLATEVLKAKRKKVADGRSVGRSVEKPTKEKPEASRPPFQGPADSVSLLPKPPRRLAKAERSFRTLAFGRPPRPFSRESLSPQAFGSREIASSILRKCFGGGARFPSKTSTHSRRLSHQQRSSEVARWRGQTPVSLGRGLQGAYTSSSVPRLTSALPAETTTRRARERVRVFSSKRAY